MKGRKATPWQIKALKSGALAPPRADDVAPDCPGFLDEDAKAEWARISPILFESGLLARVDMTALAAYCQCYSSWKRASERLALEGLTATGSVGQARLNPLVGHIDQLLKQLIRICAEFGFTPSSRQRMEAPPGPPEKEDEFLP